MTVTVKTQGFAELDRQLERLKAGTAKGAMRRAMKKAAQPMADLMASAAPRDQGDLVESITVTSKLSRRQAGLHKSQESRSAVEMFIGPGPNPQAIAQEFGTESHGPQPFARPAWDQDHQDLLTRLGEELMREVEKTIARAAARGNLIG